MQILRQYQRMLEDFVGRHSGVLWFLGSLFVIGVVFGALAVRSLASRDRADIAAYLSNTLRLLRPATPGEGGLLLKDVLTRSLQVLAALWVLGLSLVGVPLVMVGALVRGFVTGFTVAFMAAEMGWGGVLVSAAGHLPHNLVEVPALLIAGTASVSFSLQVIRSWRERRRVPNFYPTLARFSMTLAVTGLALLLAALVESYVSPALVRLAASFLQTM